MCKKNTFKPQYNKQFSYFCALKRSYAKYCSWLFADCHDVYCGLGFRCCRHGDYTFSRSEIYHECGIPSQGNARLPFSNKYFLVAILFVLFDVEVIFMYPWAVNFKGLGLTGLIEMFSFIGVFLIGFYYILKKGALTWE